MTMILSKSHAYKHLHIVPGRHSTPPKRLRFLNTLLFASFQLSQTPVGFNAHVHFLVTPFEESSSQVATAMINRS